MSNVPPLGTTVNSNPEMYCNYARENYEENKCYTCKRTDCKHCGKIRDNAL